MIARGFFVACGQLCKAFSPLSASKYSSNFKKKDIVKRCLTGPSGKEYFENLVKTIQAEVNAQATDEEQIVPKQDRDSKVESKKSSDETSSGFENDFARNAYSVSQSILQEGNHDPTKVCAPASQQLTDGNKHFKLRQRQDEKVVHNRNSNRRGLFRLTNKENTVCETKNLEDSSLSVSTITENTGPSAPKQLLDGLGEEEFQMFDKSLGSKDSHIDDLSPHLTSTFNFASLANSSETLQQLIKLGVEIYKWEEYHNLMKYILSLDFEKDMKSHIQFLHDKGVPADSLGRFITKNPLIFQQSMENLEIRINYLKSKKFSSADIARIISVSPTYLNVPTIKMDFRLGYFQKEFQLSGDEIRYLITKYPKLSVCDLRKFQAMKFHIQEEMGFSEDEMKMLLLRMPRIWLSSASLLKKKFHFLHNEVGISHEQITQNSEVLNSRFLRLKQRHLFLSKIGRVQYNPKKENYVSLKTLVIGNDTDFCRNVAKVSVEKYNEFLKTL